MGIHFPLTRGRVAIAAVLIVDDNVRLARSLARNFELRHQPCKLASSSEEALSILRTDAIGLVLLDIRLAGESGLDLFDRVRELGFDVPVVIVTGNATVENAIGALKKRAVDFIRKPIEFEELYAICSLHLGSDNRVGDHRPTLTATTNPDLRRVLREAQKLATTDIPVLITGESGTGKELLADFIHGGSSRNDREMLKINCASLPESLLESELFGHARGAFTGAYTMTKGIFERSDGSTLFLDEIGDMPMTQQAKILRVLQNNEIRRVGGHDLISVNVRFVAATNRSIDELLADGTFRQDLYYRLNAGHLHLPPLRERRADIPGLANDFAREFAGSNGGTTVRFSPEVLECFRSYRWPGNVRELRNVVHYSAAITAADTIVTNDLPRYMRPESGDTANDSDGVSMEDAERDLIRRTLLTTNNNKKEAARILKISRSTLYDKLKKHGLTDGHAHLSRPTG